MTCETEEYSDAEDELLKKYNAIGFDLDHSIIKFNDRPTLRLVM